MSSPPSWLPTLLLAPLIGSVLYRRMKRSFGRQRVHPWRMVLRMVLLSGISALLVVSLPTAAGFGAALAGLFLGIGLAAIGLAHTKFEVSAEGRFYVPNKWLGLVVTALFLGRFAARLLTFPERTAELAAGASPLAGMQRSPVTLGLFLLLAGYYVSYYAGVMRKTGRTASGVG